MAAGHWRQVGDPARTKDKLREEPVARRTRAPKTDQGRSRGLGQQDCPDRLGGAGHWRTLSPASAGQNLKWRKQRYWQGEGEVMQNRSNRGSGKPVWVKAHQARAFDWDPIRRIALGPAVMSTASTGRTHDCTRPACINVKTNLANREPSTHDPLRTFIRSTTPNCYDPRRSGVYLGNVG